MRRRDFVTFVGGAAAAWPLIAGAQQAALPIVGYLSPLDPGASGNFVAAFRKGLSEVGCVEGKNVAVEYRFGRHESDRLPELATDLVRRQVAVIATLGSNAAARAAKAATTSIPIVFATGDDPVKNGLVSALNRPGGNMTGVTTMNIDIGPKWLELLHELLPTAKRFAVLVNSEDRLATQSMITQVQNAAFANELQIVILFASSDRELQEAFAHLARLRAEALLIMPDALFLDHREQIAALALSYRVPAIYAIRAFPEVGGLMSYGSDFVDVHRMVGTYAGRIIKGEKPSELPVLRSTKFEFVINLKTANAMGLTIPPMLQARADEVIE
jgi:putative tryptophan/tyrosine transport system substrate-binding protein